MRTLLMADIHGNFAALRAILSTPAAQSCERIISLGDQVNFGPESRKVVETLRSLGATMLMGNHEERLLHPDDFSGYNWAMLRVTARQLAGISLADLPVDVRIGSALLTHGTPGDPYHLVYPPDLPEVLDTLPEDVSLLISGHNHLCWDVTSGQRRAFNPGSAGLNETGTGARAMFAIWDGDDLTPCSAPYDVTENARAYLSGGFAREAPEMSRMCLQEMETGQYQGVLRLIRHVSQVAKGMGLTLADREAWLAADATAPWREPISTADFWARKEKEA